MRINRRGSVTVESLMVLPIAVVMILLGRYILEASLNRHEAGVFARGSTVAAATARSTRARDCDFDRQDFNTRSSVSQTPLARCSRQSGERTLSREDPMWDAVEDGASAWSGILRDVKPNRSPNDIVGTGEASMTLSSPQFISQQNPTQAEQRYISPERVLWTHNEGRFDEAHDKAIWDELCKSSTYWLVPNVLPNGGGPRC